MKSFQNDAFFSYQLIFLFFLLDEGVYVNTNGKLAKNIVSFLKTSLFVAYNFTYEFYVSLIIEFELGRTAK